MQTIPCLRCTSPFERKRRGPTAHYCKPCRVVVKRERNRVRMAEHRADVDQALSRIPSEISVSAREWAYASNVLAGCKLPTQNDRMPARSKTPLGSEDGRSTYFTDLAEDLDGLAAASVRHTCLDTKPPYAHHTAADCGACFWNREPHWCVDL